MWLNNEATDLLKVVGGALQIGFGSRQLLLSSRMSAIGVVSSNLLLTLLSTCCFFLSKWISGGGGGGS